jgi:hypothetical protein
MSKCVNTRGFPIKNNAKITMNTTRMLISSLYSFSLAARKAYNIVITPISMDITFLMPVAGMVKSLDRELKGH